MLDNLDRLSSSSTVTVSIEELREDPHNPRTEFDSATLAALAESIRAKGVLQHIVVRPRDGLGYQIVMGARRFRAAKLAGLTALQVIINDDPRLDRFAQVAENEERKSLTPMEIALFIKERLREGLSKTEIAACLGRSASYVSNHLALLDLPPAIEKVFLEGNLDGVRPLYDLIAAHKKAPQLVEDWLATSPEVTRSSVARLVAVGAAPRASATSTPLPPVARGSGSKRPTSADKASSALSSGDELDVHALERRLAEKTGSKVAIKFHPGSEKGSLTFHFHGLAAIDGVISHFNLPAE
jgi:ParB family chromosome partitioning protein